MLHSWNCRNYQFWKKFQFNCWVINFFRLCPKNKTMIVHHVLVNEVFVLKKKQYIYKEKPSGNLSTHFSRLADATEGSSVRTYRNRQVEKAHVPLEIWKESSWSVLHYCRESDCVVLFLKNKKLFKYCNIPNKLFINQNQDLETSPSLILPNAPSLGDLCSGVWHIEWPGNQLWGLKTVRIYLWRSWWALEGHFMLKN